MSINNLKVFIVSVALLLSTTGLCENPIFKLSINGKVATDLVPNQPTLIEIEFLDSKTKERIKDFRTMGGKHMHFVVLKSDLSHFAHFHPTLDQSTGIFSATINIPTANPDNQGSVNAIPRAGHYFIFSEISTDKYGMVTYRSDLSAQGTQEIIPVVEDRPDENGIITKYFNEKALPAPKLSKFKVSLKINTTSVEAGSMIRFNVQVETLNAEGFYEPAQELKPWMYMGAHTILSRADHTPHAKEKFFVHTHSPMADESGGFEFNYFDRNKMETDLYKMWVQFKFDNEILTLPFVFEYNQQ